MQFDELNAEIREFCDRREWEQYHTPKELAIGLTTESSELLERFRFKDEQPKKAADLAEELIKNTYRTLMTRGMNGCYLYCCDDQLQEYMRRRIGSVSTGSS